jgi:hypothetical protein
MGNTRWKQESKRESAGKLERPEKYPIAVRAAMGKM